MKTLLTLIMLFFGITVSALLYNTYKAVSSSYAVFNIDTLKYVLTEEKIDSLLILFDLLNDIITINNLKYAIVNVNENGKEIVYNVFDNKTHKGIVRLTKNELILDFNYIVYYYKIEKQESLEEIIIPIPGVTLDSRV